MKKNVWKPILFACLAVVLGAITVYSAFSSSVTVTNFLSMGDVNISLKEYELDESGKLKPYLKSRRIVPGQTISKIPRITNLGEPCYIRARIYYENSRKELEGFADRNIKGFSKDWKKQGDYFYYTRILKNQESVDLFQEVSVPWEWTEEHAEQMLKIIIETDSIQAVHFKPDFDAASPWKDVPIETCIHEENGEIQKQKKNVELTVALEGDAYKLVAAPEDFFSNFSTWMPGDYLADQISISNHTEKTAEIFFRTEVSAHSAEERELLEKIEMQIFNGKELLYSGNILGENASENRSLGVFEAGEEAKMSFQLQVPPELGNAFAKRQGKVKWVFSTVGKEEKSNSPGPGGGSGTGGGAEYAASEQEAVKDVQTGDTTNRKFWLLLLFGTGSLIVVLFHIKGGKRIEKKTD